MILAIIKAADPSLINAITECVCNILKGRIPLSKSQKRRLASYEKDLLHLVDKKRSIKYKKRLLQKGGGFMLPALLAPIAIDLIGGLLGKVFLKKSK